MRKLVLLFLLSFLVLSTRGYAQTNQPNWVVDPAAFTYDMEVTAQVFFNSTAVTANGILGAFIDGTLQGVKTSGSTFLGKYVFIMRVYSTSTAAKTITFKFYDTARDKVYDITETAVFAVDGKVGNAASPQLFNAILGTDATLSDLKVNGTTITGFSASTLTYSVQLAVGTSVVPTVTATVTDSKATKVITPAGAIPGSTTVAVTAEDGTTLKTYTVNFVTISDDATLSELKYDGTSVPSFSAGTLTYNVALPHNTSTVPTVTATVNDSKATKVITQASSVTGSATVVVTAENGTTIKTYTINFSVAKDTDATLSDLKSDGTTVAGFSGATLTYNIALPHNTTVVPTVTSTTNDVNATKVITPAAGLPGSTTVVVTAEDGSTTKTYTINYTVLKDVDATLSDLKFDGTTVTGFSGSTLTYIVRLPLGTTIVPTVTATTNDPNATKVITPAGAIPGSTTVIVTAEDGTTQKTYTINFVLVSNDATLKDLTVSGTTVAGFSASTLTYTVVLPHNSYIVPAVDATTNDTKATKVVTSAFYVPGFTTVVVTAEDGTTKITYTVNFTIAKDVDATLSDIKVNGTSITGFAPATLSYNVELPYGTTAIPTVTVTTNDPNATKVITPAAALPGSATILVTAEDGAANKTYTLNFTVAVKSNDATLKDITLNGVSLAGFVPSTLEYNVKIPFGSTNLPIVVAIKNHALATLVITQPNTMPGTVTIVVTAQNEIDIKTYKLNFSYDLNHDASLTDLRYSTIPVPGFSPTVFDYSVTVAFQTQVPPTITALATDNKATLLITQAVAIPGIATVKVTAANGTSTSTYTIHFVRGNPSTDAKLTMIFLDGKEFAGFNPDKLDYSIKLPCAYPQLPVVTVFTSGDFATKTIVNITGYPGTATIRVIAQDGVTSRTYQVAINKDNCNADASLKDLKVNGQTISGFAPGTLSYELVLDANIITTPVVAGTANIEDAVLVVTQAAGIPGTATVKVTATDGTTENIYEVSIRYKSNEARLSGILIGGQTVTGFNRDILNYTLTGLADTKTLPTVVLQKVNAKAVEVIAKTETKTDDGYYRTIVFTVTVTAEDGITKLVYTCDLSFILTGITENALNSEMNLFPNPTKGRFDVIYAGTASAGSRIEIKIVDITGKVIYDFKTENQGSVTTVPVDLSDCQPGIYFVQLRSGQDLKVKRLVVN